MVREVGFVDRSERYCVQQQQIALRDGYCDITVVLVVLISERSSSNHRKAIWAHSERTMIIMMKIMVVMKIPCSLCPSKTMVTRTPSSSPDPPGRGKKCISELSQSILSKFCQNSLLFIYWPLGSFSSVWQLTKLTLGQLGTCNDLPHNKHGPLLSRTHSSSPEPFFGTFNLIMRLVMSKLLHHEVEKRSGNDGQPTWRE